MLSIHALCFTLAVAISAAGLSNLAADPDNHWRVLESDNMLKMLLRALALDHALAQHHILRLLCGLVSNEATQAEVVSAGVVRALQDMGNRDMHASAISLILFNISCDASLSGRYAETFGWLLASGWTVAIVQISLRILLVQSVRLFCNNGS